jgi:hypothetical protein
MDLLGHLSVTIGLGQIIYFIVSLLAHLLVHEKSVKKCSLKCAEVLSGGLLPRFRGCARARHSDHAHVANEVENGCGGGAQRVGCFAGEAERHGRMDFTGNREEKEIVAG